MRREAEKPTQLNLPAEEEEEGKEAKWWSTEMELDETGLAIQPSLHLRKITTLTAIIPLLHHSI